MEKREKIFVDGMISKEVPESAPEFILGQGSFNVDRLINFLNNNRQYGMPDKDKNVWLNYKILRSKTSGKRYVELDMYQYDKNRSEGLAEEDKKAIQGMRERAMSAQEPTVGDDPNANIPF